jgi:hypothetical protein
MIIYNWLIFKDVSLLRPIGMMNGRDANAPVEDIITKECVKMNGLAGTMLLVAQQVDSFYILKLQDYSFFQKIVN